jgi:hypothetical protein
MSFDKKKRAAELAALSNKEIIKLGGKLGLKLNDKAAKRQLISEVLEAENKKFLEGAAGGPAEGDATDADLNTPIAGSEEQGAGAETPSPASPETLPPWALEVHSRIGSLESIASGLRSTLDQAHKRIAALEAALQKAGHKLETACGSLHGKVSALRKK